MEEVRCGRVRVSKLCMDELCLWVRCVGVCVWCAATITDAPRQEVRRRAIDA